jgi:hypothetical protein
LYLVKRYRESVTDLTSAASADLSNIIEPEDSYSVYFIGNKNNKYVTVI